MTSQTQTTITADFEITEWDDASHVPPAGAPELAGATVRKRFSGPLQGTSVAVVLLAGGEDGGKGYVASERIEGTLDGRAGTFVLQHGGVGDAHGAHAFGHVVPGTATGELRGLRAAAAYQHDDDGARLTLTYTL